MAQKKGKEGALVKRGGEGNATEKAKKTAQLSVRETPRQGGVCVEKEAFQ